MSKKISELKEQICETANDLSHCSRPYVSRSLYNNILQKLVRLCVELNTLQINEDKISWVEPANRRVDIPNKKK
jgi:hypothetical protein